MVDTAKQGTGTDAGNAAPVKDLSDIANTPAATPVAIAPEAAPAAKAVPTKENDTSGKKDPSQAVTKAEPAVKAVVPAKAPERKPAVRKVRPAATPAVAAAPVAPAPEVAAVVKAPAITKTQTAKPAAAPLLRKATASRKESRTMTTPTTEYAEKFQTVIKDASEKAKAAFEKSQSQFGEIGAFTKGNVEALVESSKILASGLQELTKGYAAESKSAFEALTAEFKSLAAVKSPSELLEKQSTLLRKQFDSAVAASSKNSEAVLKLANEAFQPISNRVSIAVEKVKHVA